MIATTASAQHRISRSAGTSCCGASTASPFRHVMWQTSHFVRHAREFTPFSKTNMRDYKILALAIPQLNAVVVSWAVAMAALGMWIAYRRSFRGALVGLVVGWALNGWEPWSYAEPVRSDCPTNMELDIQDLCPPSPTDCQRLQCLRHIVLCEALGAKPAALKVIFTHNLMALSLGVGLGLYWGASTSTCSRLLRHSEDGGLHATQSKSRASEPLVAHEGLA